MYLVVKEKLGIVDNSFVYIPEIDGCVGCSTLEKAKKTKELFEEHKKSTGLHEGCRWYIKPMQLI